jgi:hypothetical protein
MVIALCCLVASAVAVAASIVSALKFLR